jgi:glycosyltransferase involved in cell wall biosynthesis
VNSSNPRVAILVEHYLPGFRSGGPLRSIAALIEQLGDEIDFFVISRDRDAGSDQPYPAVLPNSWQPVGKAKVRYLAPEQIGVRAIVKAIREVDPHAVYLNSLFSPLSQRLLIARRMGGLGTIPVLLAPRGELSPGALRLKALKKRCYLRLAALTRLHVDVVFHASTERERDEIAHVMQSSEPPRVARNPVALGGWVAAPRTKTCGVARFIFVSRIARKKNVHLAIEHLRSLEGLIEFDIYGPVDDHAYWRECVGSIDRLPANVKVTYHGAIAHDAVIGALGSHHFFLFPTAGENFGHAIVEALLAGCPVITSDQTPWADLSNRRAGWELALDDHVRWRHVLQHCVDMNDDAYAAASLRSRSFGEQIASTDTALENSRLLHSIIDSNRRVSRGERKLA